MTDQCLFHWFALLHQYLQSRRERSVKSQDSAESCPPRGTDLPPWCPDWHGRNPQWKARGWREYWTWAHWSGHWSHSFFPRRHFAWKWRSSTRSWKPELLGVPSEMKLNTMLGVAAAHQSLLITIGAGLKRENTLGRVSAQDRSSSPASSGR